MRIFYYFAFACMVLFSQDITSQTQLFRVTSTPIDFSVLPTDMTEAVDRLERNDSYSNITPVVINRIQDALLREGSR